MPAAGWLVYLQTFEDVVAGGKLRLVRPDPRAANRSVGIDQERRRPRVVPGEDAAAVPHAVGADRVAALVDQHVERQAGLFDIAANLLAPVGDDGSHLQAAGCV